MILSFAWTTTAFLAGRKTCTRRDWADRTMLAWQHAWDRGDLVHDAVDKLLFRGGKRIGRLKLTCRPYRERLGDMPERDLAAEGGMWADLDEFIMLQGGDPDKRMCVIRFEPILPESPQMEMGLDA